MDYYTQGAGGDSFHEWEKMVYPSKQSFRRPSSLNTSEGVPGLSQASSSSTPGPATPVRADPRLMSPYTHHVASHTPCQDSWYCNPIDCLSPSRSARFDQSNWALEGQHIHSLTARAMQGTNESQYESARSYLNAPNGPVTDLSFSASLPLQWAAARQNQYLQPAYMPSDVMPAEEELGDNAMFSLRYNGTQVQNGQSFSAHGQACMVAGVAPSEISSFGSQLASDEDFNDHADVVPCERKEVEVFFSKTTTPVRRQRRGSAAKAFSVGPKTRRPSTNSRRRTVAHTNLSSCDETRSHIEFSWDRSQDPEKKFPCPSQGCKVKFRRGEHLKRHIRTCHSDGDNPFLCALAFGGSCDTCTINQRTTSRKEPGEGKTAKKLGIARRDNQYQHYQTHLKSKEHTTRNRIVSPDFLFFLILKYEDFSEDGANVVRQVRKACAKDNFAVGVPDVEYMNTHLDRSQYLHWLARQERFGGVDRYVDELDAELDVTHAADRFANLILADVKCEAEEVEEGEQPFCD